LYWPQTFQMVGTHKHTFSFPGRLDLLVC